MIWGTGGSSRALVEIISASRTEGPMHDRFKSLVHPTLNVVDRLGGGMFLRFLRGFLSQAGRERVVSRIDESVSIAGGEHDKQSG